jgi:hypothetical protein
MHHCYPQVVVLIRSYSIGTSPRIASDGAQEDATLVVEELQLNYCADAVRHISKPLGFNRFPRARSPVAVIELRRENMDAPVQRNQIVQITTLLEGWSKVVRVAYRQLKRDGT